MNLTSLTEAAMRTEMHAQTRQSSYVKAVNRYVIDYSAFIKYHLNDEKYD